MWRQVVKLLMLCCIVGCANTQSKKTSIFAQAATVNTSKVWEQAKREGVNQVFESEVEMFVLVRGNANDIVAANKKAIDTALEKMIEHAVMNKRWAVAKTYHRDNILILKREMEQREGEYHVTILAAMSKFIP